MFGETHPFSCFIVFMDMAPERFDAAVHEMSVVAVTGIEEGAVGGLVVATNTGLRTSNNTPRTKQIVLPVEPSCWRSPCHGRVDLPTEHMT